MTTIDRESYEPRAVPPPVRQELLGHGGRCGASLCAPSARACVGARELARSLAGSQLAPTSCTGGRCATSSEPSPTPTTEARWPTARRGRHSGRAAAVRVSRGGAGRSRPPPRSHVEASRTFAGVLHSSLRRQPPWNTGSPPSPTRTSRLRRHRQSRRSRTHSPGSPVPTRLTSTCSALRGRPSLAAPLRCLRGGAPASRSEQPAPLASAYTGDGGAATRVAGAPATTPRGSAASSDYSAGLERCGLVALGLTKRCQQSVHR